MHMDIDKTTLKNYYELQYRHLQARNHRQVLVRALCLVGCVVCFFGCSS